MLGEVKAGGGGDQRGVGGVTWWAQRGVWGREGGVAGGHKEVFGRGGGNWVGTKRCWGRRVCCCAR